MQARRAMQPPADAISIPQLPTRGNSTAVKIFHSSACIDRLFLISCTCRLNYAASPSFGNHFAVLPHTMATSILRWAVLRVICSIIHHHTRHTTTDNRHAGGTHSHPFALLVKPLSQPGNSSYSLCKLPSSGEQPVTKAACLSQRHLPREPPPDV